MHCCAATGGWAGQWLVVGEMDALCIALGASSVEPPARAAPPASDPLAPPPLLPSVQSLETLTVTFMSGRVSSADLAPLEGLRRLRALTLSASRDAEEGGEHCLAGFPESLLKLRGLTSLAVTSLGALLQAGWHGCWQGRAAADYSRLVGGC